MNTLGQRLRKARERKGWTQTDVCKQLKISNSRLSGYERDYREPDKKMLTTLANLYNVSIDSLLGRIEENKFTLDEKELLSEDDLTIKKLKNKYAFLIDQKDASDEEIEELIRLIKTWKAMKKE